ncbi:MAG: DUF4157 domain-containing protein, partial [Firmicutes bacterium]|nr:DUF4157 domain-containing protein [Bacillota bacterium]
AFAKGNIIGFDSGKFNPSSQSGQELLGHELSHVVSQGRGEVKGGKGKGLGLVSDAALESRADKEGAMAARGQSIGLAPLGEGLSGSLGNSPMQAKKDKPEPTHDTYDDDVKRVGKGFSSEIQKAKKKGDLGRYVSVMERYTRGKNNAFRPQEDMDYFTMEPEDTSYSSDNVSDVFTSTKEGSFSNAYNSELDFISRNTDLSNAFVQEKEKAAVALKSFFDESFQKHIAAKDSADIARKKAMLDVRSSPHLFKYQGIQKMLLQLSQRSGFNISFMDDSKSPNIDALSFANNLLDSSGARDFQSMANLGNREYAQTAYRNALANRLNEFHNTRSILELKDLR